MAYLEELLPEFRKGAKIRSSMWSKKAYIHLKDGKILDESGLPYTILAIAFHINDWEFYQEPIDWDYIIKNKCLCWFWDDINSLEESSYGYLILYNEYTQRYYNGKKWYKNCRPVRKDEVNFYE
nr:MAG TPA: hypothetical protein [Caudoviricetes sp.]